MNIQTTADKFQHKACGMWAGLVLGATKLQLALAEAAGVSKPGVVSVPIL